MPALWSKDRIRGYGERIKPALPKLPAPVEEFAKRYLARFTPGFWIWSVITFILAFIAALFLTRTFLTGEHLSGRALETGQRVFIHVESGDIEGNPRHSKLEASPDVKAATPEIHFSETNTSEAHTEHSGEAHATGEHSGETNVTKTKSSDTETSVMSKDGLVPAPLTSISSQTEKGLVPVIGKDGTLPWKYYARPFSQTQKRPFVSIVITRLGLSKPLTEETLTLPHDFTLSFSPYASDAKKWARQARAQGFETLIDLPMQSADYKKTGADPGPYGLFEEMTPDERSRRLNWVISRFPGFVGALAPEDENLTPNMAAIRPTVTELTGHGVLFLYMKTPKNNELAEAGKSHQLTTFGIDKVIDSEIEPEAIKKQLAALVELSKTQGYAVGFAHSYPPTLKTLKFWAEELDAQGVDLAPLSAAAMAALK